MDQTSENQQARRQVAGGMGEGYTKPSSWSILRFGVMPCPHSSTVTNVKKNFLNPLHVFGARLFVFDDSQLIATDDSQLIATLFLLPGVYFFVCWESQACVPLDIILLVVVLLDLFSTIVEGTEGTSLQG